MKALHLKALPKYLFGNRPLLLSYAVEQVMRITGAPKEVAEAQVGNAWEASVGYRKTRPLAIVPDDRAAEMVSELQRVLQASCTVLTVGNPVQEFFGVR